jgi:hypothetical protein
MYLTQNARLSQAKRKGVALSAASTLSSMWQTRRVVWSKDAIYFARINETTFFDSIPLAEVRGIDKVDEAPAVGSSAPSARLRKTRSMGNRPSLAPTLSRSTPQSKAELNRTLPC